MTGLDNVSAFEFRDLLSVRRVEDQGIDLYSVMNVVQENVIRNHMRYTLNAVKVDGTPYIRNVRARGIGESSIRSIEVNAKLWDLATSFLIAA